MGGICLRENSHGPVRPGLRGRIVAFEMPLTYAGLEWKFRYHEGEDGAPCAGEGADDPSTMTPAVREADDARRAARAAAGGGAGGGAAAAPPCEPVAARAARRLCARLQPPPRNCEHDLAELVARERGRAAKARWEKQGPDGVDFYMALTLRRDADNASIVDAYATRARELAPHYAAARDELVVANKARAARFAPPPPSLALRSSRARP